MTTTREIYLENFEKLPETEIAKLAGVSRQRIHQLEAKFSVCKMAASKKHEHHCFACGKKLNYLTKSGLCRKCLTKTMQVELVCPTCETKFFMNKRQHEWKRKHGQKEFFCNRKCHGVKLGKEYGVVNLLKYIKEHHHQPKYDYDMVWQKHKETHYGSLRLSRLLGIPSSTIDNIFTKKRKETGIRYKTLPAIPRKWDRDLVWSKHLETGYSCAELSQLLSIPSSAISSILWRKRKELGLICPRTRHCKWDKELVWQKYLETGFGAIRLSRLLNIPEKTISAILAKKRKELAITSNPQREGGDKRCES